MSVLGLHVLTIFIDDIDEDVLCEISKFTGDTNIANQVNILNDIRSMQSTFSKLVAWANRWDSKECGVIHIMKINLEFQY